MYISDYTPVLNDNFSFQWDMIIIKQKLHTSIYPHTTLPLTPPHNHTPPSGTCTCYILLGFETVSVERERTFSVVPDVYL